jgi:hypothetical protein
VASGFAGGFGREAGWEGLGVDEIAGAWMAGKAERALRAVSIRDDAAGRSTWKALNHDLAGLLDETLGSIELSVDVRGLHVERIRVVGCQSIRCRRVNTSIWLDGMRPVLTH